MGATIRAKYQGVEVELVTCWSDEQAQAAARLHDGGVIDVEALTGEVGTPAERVWLREQVKILAGRKQRRAR
jgi:hypothetical protein